MKILEAVTLSERDTSFLSKLQQGDQVVIYQDDSPVCLGRVTHFRNSKPGESSNTIIIVDQTFPYEQWMRQGDFDGETGEDVEERGYWIGEATPKILQEFYEQRKYDILPYLLKTIKSEISNRFQEVEKYSDLKVITDALGIDLDKVATKLLGIDVNKLGEISN